MAAVCGTARPAPQRQSPAPVSRTFSAPVFHSILRLLGLRLILLRYMCAFRAICGRRGAKKDAKKRKKACALISADLFFIKNRASRKPSSVYVTIYLDVQLPARSSDYGERDGQPLNAPISILLRVGFTGHASSPKHRWALTPPFHPYRKAAVYFCCTFLEVAFTGCYPAPCPVELGLSSHEARSLGLLDPYSVFKLHFMNSSRPQFSHWMTWFPAATFLSWTEESIM